MNKRVRSIKKLVEFITILTAYLLYFSTITGCVSISDFAPLVGIPTEITSSANGLKICAITARIKKYESIIKKKKKNDKIVLLAKSKLKRLLSYFLRL